MSASKKRRPTEREQRELYRSHGARLAESAPPITDAQAEAAARLFVAAERAAAEPRLSRPA